VASDGARPARRGKRWNMAEGTLTLEQGAQLRAALRIGSAGANPYTFALPFRLSSAETNRLRPVEVQAEYPFGTLQRSGRHPPLPVAG
jgi:hypothetical protein